MGEWFTNKPKRGENKWRYTDDNERQVEMLLGENQSTTFDSMDMDMLFAQHWCLQSGSNGLAYAKTKLKGKNVYMHRMLIPDAEVVDHKDGNGLNNCRDNILNSTTRDNANNQRMYTTNTSGFNGVSFQPKYPRYLASFHDGSSKSFSYGVQSKRSQEEAFELAVSAREKDDLVSGCKNGRRPKFEDVSVIVKQRRSRRRTSRCMLKNNSTGVRGLCDRPKQKLYEFTWYPNGIRHSKSFGYGPRGMTKILAFETACLFRVACEL